MVIETVEAIYDGEVLHPKKRLGIKPNSAVIITVKPIKPRRSNKKSALEVIETLNVDAPPDWSENIEHYLQAEKNGHEQ